MSPKDGRELERMMEYAIENRLTACIRYPRGKAYHYGGNCKEMKLELGMMETVKDGKDVAIITEGGSFRKGWHIWRSLKQKGYSPALINARFISPIDREGIASILEKFEKVLVIEENLNKGGLGDRIAKILSEKPAKARLKCFAYPDQFMKHGDVELLEEDYRMNWESILADALPFLEGE